MRVVGDNVEQPVVLPIRDALKLADEMELDLIEISPKADPPVCLQTICHGKRSLWCSIMETTTSSPFFKLESP